MRIEGDLLLPGEVKQQNGKWPPQNQVARVGVFAV
jgi:hypothetical protein